MNTPTSASPWIRFMMLSTAICAIAMSSACNKPSTETRNAAQSAIEWKNVREQTTCEGGETSRCIGYHGFTVTRDGRYQVGEGVKQLTGSLQPEEKLRIEDSVAALISQLSSAPIRCENLATIPGLGIRVELVLESGTTLRVYEIHQAKLCTLGEKELAKALQADLRALMKRYYPIPYP